jgi:single-strand DNA-binding protein
MNQVNLKGHLVRDAESRKVGSNTVTNITIAFNESYIGKDGKKVDNAHFFDCERWNVSPKLLTYLVKGKEVLIQGNLMQNRWESDGKKFSRVIISIQKIELLGGVPKKASGKEVVETAEVVQPNQDQLLFEDFPEE